ncbi:thiamine ABC transporter substrate binding subunit [Streptomyces sp. NEAU-H3]|uniref:thiamine ABC transporter substrate-binding protein n=1 Tax=Streptomyces sp. NEAU-H3 TaxID=2720636 RepID=UPI0014387A97|nr:thiamine ABC transporter substrate-binding protein [Streptomyces sp. NEAU-H3]NJA57969.1 thiamine ABC transporter substrate-binding protein [Streptomyces sp. NEAU-H3]
MSTRRKIVAAIVAAGLAATGLAACGDDSAADAGPSSGKTVTLVSHDSFAASKSVLKKFEQKTGYRLKVLKSGDAGQAVNQAVLTKGHPQGDVFFGVDNTLLSRALDQGVFQPYEAKGLSAVPADLQLDGKRHRVTPIDTGDVCVNYDKKYFEGKKLDPPKTLADLADPAYKNLLVTENTATSSPGLGFLLGSVAQYGERGWQAYWKKLRANGVKVVDSWEQAYNEEFSGSAGGRKAGGDRPLVVSYASSPPVEVLYADPRPEDAPTGVATGTCFRQTEFAGLLGGAPNPEGGKALLDFLLSDTFQRDMPLQMFVNPVVKGTALPDLFTRYGAEADGARTVEPQKIAEHREDWINAWTSLVVK